MNTEPEEDQDLESSRPPPVPEENSDEEDYEEFQLQEEYFTSVTPKNARHKWLILFYRQVAQHCRWREEKEQKQAATCLAY